MILYLDTSTDTCILKLDNQTYTWESKRALADNLHKFIIDKLAENHASLKDLEKIIFMSGPGSFTGLRIGAAIVNTLATELKIPLFDHHGAKHQIIIPDYGRPANITSPKSTK